MCYNFNYFVLLPFVCDHKNETDFRGFGVTYSRVAILHLYKYIVNKGRRQSFVSAQITSRQRASGCIVIDDIEFPMAILAYFFLAAV